MFKFLENKKETSIMFGSIFKLSTKLKNQSVVRTLSKNVAQKRTNMEGYFKDKRFIVTGASSGIYKILLIPIYNKNILYIYNLLF